MTADKFIPAVDEIRAALEIGEDLDQVLAEIADDHRLAPQALRNRAERALGDLATYRQRRAEAVPGNTEEERRLWVKAREILLARAKEAGMRTTVQEIDARLRKAGVEWALTEKIPFVPTPATFNTVPRPAWIKK
jgi:hypothetical protein